MFTRILLFGAVLCVALPAHAYDPDALRQQQESWRQTEAHFDAWINDIRNRPSRIASPTFVPPTKTKAQLEDEDAQRKAYWERQRAETEAYNRASERISAENARINAANALINAQENARIRQKQAAKPAQYARFLEISQGFGTRQMPPDWANARSEFYLTQANAGDGFAAFWMGRAFLSGTGAPKNPSEGIGWLQKADLKIPLAAAALGVELARGQYLPRDLPRSRELLERASREDITGQAAWLYGSLLRDGIGFEKDVDAAAFQLLRADGKAGWLGYGGNGSTLWDEYGWGAEADVYPQGRRQIFEDGRQIWVENISHVASWLQKWDSDPAFSGDGESLRMLNLLNSNADATLAPTLSLTRLNAIEAKPARQESLAVRHAIVVKMLSFGGAERQARALLPYGGSYPDYTPTQIGELWQGGGAQIESWAATPGPFQQRARAALLDRATGRWPQLGAPQSPAQIAALLSGWNAPEAPELLAESLVWATSKNVAPWNDARLKAQWIAQMAAQSPQFAGLPIAIERARARAFARFDATPREQLVAEFAQTQRAVVARGEDFTPAELQSARQLAERGDDLRITQPREAYSLWLQALRGGDAVSAWFLLSAPWPHNAPDGSQQWLLDLLDARLQRDAAGEGDNAATAAFALHLLHEEARGKNVYGRTLDRKWRLTRPDETDWMKVAIAKGHPWALYYSKYHAAQMAENRYNAEDQKVWPWVAVNFPVIQLKRALWERDSRWFDMQSPAADIAELQKPVSAVEAAQSDAARFAETMKKLESARLMCAQINADPTLADPKKAEAFYQSALDVAVLDKGNKAMLPSHRADSLELYTLAAIQGHPVAPLMIAQMLKVPQFPYASDASEAAKWLGLGKNRLVAAIKTAPVEKASYYAGLLASELRTGELFNANPAEALKFYTLSAQLGNYENAAYLAASYENGDEQLQIKADPVQAKKWHAISEQILQDEYKVPPALLAGRAQK